MFFHAYYNNYIRTSMYDARIILRKAYFDSISRIRSIRVLQNLGLSLDEISSYYNGTTDLESLIERLEVLRDELTQRIF